MRMTTRPPVPCARTDGANGSLSLVLEPVNTQVATDEGALDVKAAVKERFLGTSAMRAVLEEGRMRSTELQCRLGSASGDPSHAEQAMTFTRWVNCFSGDEFFLSQTEEYDIVAGKRLGAP